MSAGEYGGRVLRKFEGGGKTWISGATLTPEDVAEWPYSNRMSLHRTGKVEWFTKPDAEEYAARGRTETIEEDETKQPVRAKEVQTKSKRTTKAKK